MTTIYSSVACNLDAHILSASLPLFAEGKIEAVEWSFDALYQYPEIPEWFGNLIGTFSENNRLTGHGIYFSLFSGKWTEAQAGWLKKLRSLSSQYNFDHVSEHFGFMTGKDFHHGAPLGVPYTDSTLRIGIDRLKRIQEACSCPAGLENLAFSYSPDEVKKHGEFLEKLVSPVNGFIILDLHNLYCQLCNFGFDYHDMIGLYPLERVREIHISGGSWQDSHTEAGRVIRRDTHDNSVPEEVFGLLKATIPRCPQLKFVVLEQMGTSLDTGKSRREFQNDFLRMDAIVKNSLTSRTACLLNHFMPEVKAALTAPPAEDPVLYEQQCMLSLVLEKAEDYGEALRLLSGSPLANSPWDIENWDPSMLETAVRIAQKWQGGFERRQNVT